MKHPPVPEKVLELSNTEINSNFRTISAGLIFTHLFRGILPSKPVPVVLFWTRDLHNKMDLNYSREDPHFRIVSYTDFLIKIERYARSPNESDCFQERRLNRGTLVTDHEFNFVKLEESHNEKLQGVLFGEN